MIHQKRRRRLQWKGIMGKASSESRVEERSSAAEWKWWSWWWWWTGVSKMRWQWHVLYTCSCRGQKVH